MSKICRCCNALLPDEAFYKDASKPDGLKSHCKKCAEHRRYNRRQNSFAIADEKYSIISGERYTSKRHENKAYKHVCQYCGKTLDKPHENNVCSDDCYRNLQTQVFNYVNDEYVTDYKRVYSHSNATVVKTKLINKQ